MDSLVYSLNATIPIFAVMVLGYLLRRIGLLNEEFVNVANKLVFRVALPCMLFLDLWKTNVKESFDGKYIAYCAVVTLVSILVIWGLAKWLMKDRASVGAFVQASYRSSAAILGIAFIENIYGNAGMGPMMIIGSVPLYNIFAVLILTLESNEESLKKGSHGRMKKALLGIITNPIIIGIALGLCASLVQLKLPDMLTKGMDYLGRLTSPLALLAIGAGFQGKEALKKMRPTLVATFLKLVGLAAVFLPLAIFLGFRDGELLALIIMLGSPTTATAYIMTKNMHGDSVLSASVIVLTTMLSAFTLTFWIFLARYLGYL